MNFITVFLLQLELFTQALSLRAKKGNIESYLAYNFNLH